MENVFCKSRSIKMGISEIFLNKETKSITMIKENSRYNFIAYDPDEEIYLLISSPEDGGDAEAIEISIDDMFIIPEVTKLKELYRSGVKNAVDEKWRLYSKLIFFIADYTMLDDASFKDCDFSGKSVRVRIVNTRGASFGATMKVAEDVYGCDGNPRGELLGEVYRMIPVAKIMNEDFVPI